MLLLYNDTVSAILFNCFLPPLPPLIKIKYYATLDLYVINYFIRNKNDAKEIFSDCSKWKREKLYFPRDRELWSPREGEEKWKIGNVSSRLENLETKRFQRAAIEFLPWSNRGIRVISKNQASRAHTFLSIFPSSQILSARFEIRLTIPCRIKIPSTFFLEFIYIYMCEDSYIYAWVECHWKRCIESNTVEKKHLYNLFLFSLLNILFLSHLLNFSFAETRLHPRGGSSVFFRGAVGRRPVSLAEELHEGGDGSIGERDTLPDEFRAHRVSRETNLKFACTSRNQQ